MTLWPDYASITNGLVVVGNQQAFGKMPLMRSNAYGKN
jgi:hypothetical protein